MTCDLLEIPFPFPMAFDVLRSCIGTFASKASNELESDVKGCLRSASLFSLASERSPHPPDDQRAAEVHLPL